MRKTLAFLLLIALFFAHIFTASAQEIGALTSVANTLAPVATNLTATSTLCRTVFLLGFTNNANAMNAATVYICGSTNATAPGIPLTTGAVLRIDGGPMGIDLSKIYYRPSDTNDRVSVVYVK